MHVCRYLSVLFCMLIYSTNKLYHLTLAIWTFLFPSLSLCYRRSGEDAGDDAASDASVMTCSPEMMYVLEMTPEMTPFMLYVLEMYVQETMFSLLSLFWVFPMCWRHLSSLRLWERASHCGLASKCGFLETLNSGLCLEQPMLIS